MELKRIILMSPLMFMIHLFFLIIKMVMETDLNMNNKLFLLKQDQFLL